MKLRLSVLEGTLVGQSFELTTGFLTIGRSENCSVRFDPAGERIASKQHAFIEAKPDGFYIEDNNSTNGTILNGSLIKTAKLKDGDEIQFGRNGVRARVKIETVLRPAPDPNAMRIAEIEAAMSGSKSFQDSIVGLGLGHLEPPKLQQQQRKPTRALVGIGFAILFFVPLAIIVAGIMLLSLGLIPAIIATLIAFTPSVLYILPLIGLDRYDPEPFWLLASAFAWGAVVAVLVSFVVNSLFGSAVYVGTQSPDLASIVSAIVSAPVIEEASKGVGLLILLLFFRRYFDDILDGIVYGGVIALGFATVENVLYYGDGLNRAYLQYGITSDALASFLLLFTLRGILSPFAHVTFTAMTGIGCGIARESHSTIVRLLSPVIGYLAAVVLHGIWNGFGLFATVLLVRVGLEPACASIGLGGEDIGLCGFFTFYLILEVPLFLIFIGFTYFIMRRQRRILKDMLAIDVARGLISQEQLRIATSVIRSSLWLIKGLFSGKYITRSRFVRAVGKLGLSYWHIQRATAAHGHTGSFQQNPILRNEVLRWRDKV
ncbi:MAG: hypothetical protein C4325_07135 [Blastocatellia bacterium]